MRIVGANGIRTHGAGNIDLFLLEMRARGFDTLDCELPRRDWWNARFLGERDAGHVIDASRDGDIIVAHSRGCILAYHAHLWVDYAAIVLVAPAMSRHTEWQEPERVHCFYSPDDWAIRIGSWMPFWHPFGPAGNRGFSQPGVVNHRWDGLGHNDFFYGTRLQAMCDYVARLADEQEPDFV